MKTVQNSAEKKKEQVKEVVSESSDMAKLVVRQPPHLKSLLVMLSDLERISEVIREDSSGDLGTSGSYVYVGSGGVQGASIRDRAIKALPSTEAMRHRITGHLQKEVKQLEHKAKRFAHSAKTGSAFALNEMYAKIRRIQSLIAELIEATADMVKSLYIRLFIDHQKLV